MSQIDFVSIVKELGFAGIALYALWVMNGLQTAIKDLSVVVQKLCDEVDGK